MTALWIAVAAAVGAVARYLVDGAVRERSAAASLPAGTITVNLGGSFLLGLLTGVGLFRGLDPATRAVLGAGLLGSYTTFSAFAYETVALARRRASPAARLNVVVGVGGGVVASALGIGLAGIIWHSS